MNDFPEGEPTATPQLEDQTREDRVPLAAWREPTAPRIFANAVFAVTMAFVQLIGAEALLGAQGMSENVESAAATTVAITMIVCVIGGWIGFAYSRRPRSDRGFLLLACWGLSTAVGTTLLLVIQPAAMGRVP